MSMPEAGRPKAEVLAALREFKKKDVAWEEGRVMTSIFLATQEGREVAEEAYTMYLWENGLDPSAFASLPQMEREVVGMAKAHLRGGPDVVGSFTSGGTESCMLAVKTARDWCRTHRPHITKPQIVIPATGHPAFHKGCQYFGVEAVVTPIDPVTCRADVAAMAAAITDQTILVVGSACSFPHGSVDDITAIGKIAKERDLLFHVDGCIGGFLLPLWRRLGATVTEFDFTVPGVTSMSMDFHKYALCAKGASVILYRDAELRRHQFFCYSNWPGYAVVNTTMQSSKSGGPIAATWATLNHYGYEGYLEVAKGLRQATERCREIVDGIDGLRIVGEPEICLLAIGSDGANGVDVFAVADKMEARGWHMYPQLGRQGMEATLHVTMLPWTVERIDAWGEELRQAVEEVRQQPAPEGGGLAAMAASLDLEGLSAAQIGELMEAAGIDPKAIGGEMAEINRLLDALPPRVTDEVFRVFLDQLTR